MQQILVIEDNTDYREVLRNFLESANYAVTVAKDGVEALILVRQHVFDLILLDLMLPEIDGYCVCEMIRKDSDVPIIMLTALGSEAHQARGYILHIEDYIIKLVYMPILLQKVATVLHKTTNLYVDHLTYRNIILDLKGHTVCVSGNLIDFTLREFEILKELLRVPGEVITRKMLLTKLWDYDFYVDERIIDTHIKNIRRKLGVDDYIETVRAVGYRLQKVD